jgi:pimeloyl-ACP methyl ester carboxylesterase
VGPAVLPALAGTHRVCAYDRPGTLRYSDPPTLSDRSSPVAMPRTAQDVVDDLHALLAAAHLRGPYLLVGHSLGGLFARLYAQTYPDQVCAVVFVDAFGIEIPKLLGSEWPDYRQALAQPLPQFADSSAFEVVDIDKSVEQVAAAPAFPPIPNVVLTRTEPFVIPATVPAEQGARLEQAWREAATDLVALRPQTPHLVATGSDHFIQIHQPDLVVGAVELATRRSAPQR